MRMSVLPRPPLVMGQIKQNKVGKQMTNSIAEWN